ncbi:hypothetical protein CLV48_10284 [Cecembia rubra]|uniref:Uncharacterized protein n=1 Tax=Cecembia rubra TaxID=1485585 RepID=A0A2P8E9X6_9BACT|nr:hypothetical protein CLV48_10284 [Cecembia rubra]
MYFLHDNLYKLPRLKYDFYQCLIIKSNQIKVETLITAIFFCFNGIGVINGPKYCLVSVILFRYIFLARKKPRRA